MESDLKKNKTLKHLVSQELSCLVRAFIERKANIDSVLPLTDIIQHVVSATMVKLQILALHSENVY